MSWQEFLMFKEMMGSKGWKAKGKSKGKFAQEHIFLTKGRHQAKAKARERAQANLLAKVVCTTHSHSSAKAAEADARAAGRVQQMEKSVPIATN